MHDAGRAKHEPIGLGCWLFLRIVPRLMPPLAEKRHKHISNVRRALTPAFLPQHAMRLQINLTDACETMALTKTVAAKLRTRCAECSS